MTAYLLSSSTARASWQNLSTRFVDKEVLHKIRLSHLRDVLEVHAAPGERAVVPRVREAA